MSGDAPLRGPSILVIIPARGGSKGIPRKNVRSLGGRPLLAYAIGTALASRYDPRSAAGSLPAPDPSSEEAT
ncbi:MAG: hypothetical protein ABI598_06890 [Chloroflexota bacterium]